MCACGRPTLPYVVAGAGYPVLLLVTLLFVWRFIASLKARAAPAIPRLPWVLPAQS